MVTLSLMAQAAVIALLLGIAWYDVRRFKILNWAVIALLLLYLPAQGALGFPHWQTDLLAGAILFAMGFVMWLLRGLGAGDAKLMFPLGLNLGQVALVPFALLLLLVSVLLYAVILAADLLKAQRGLAGWLAGLRRGGRVPYGLVLTLASVPVLGARLLWIA